MARPRDYSELIVWQKAMALARSAYSATANFPKSEAYGLLAQIRRAAVSIPSNIAEGHGRLTDSQFRHFLGNARGSVYELETQIDLACDMSFIDQSSKQRLLDSAVEVAKLINGLLGVLVPQG